MELTSFTAVMKIIVIMMALRDNSVAAKLFQGKEKKERKKFPGINWIEAEEEIEIRNRE